MHLAAGQQGVVRLLDDARDHVTAVHRQVGGHDGDIAIGRERIAREVAGLGFDAVGDAVGGDEVARHLADHRQVEHHGADRGMFLGGGDAVGARAATDIHDALAARKIDLADEAAAGAQADREGRRRGSVAHRPR